MAFEPVPSATGVAGSYLGAGVTATPLARGTGLSQPSPAPGNNYNARGFDFTTSATALAGGDILSWGFTSTVAYDLTTLDISYGRTTGGPSQIEILLSVNGGSAMSIWSDTVIQVGAEVNPGIDLSSYTNVTSASFVLVGWSATNTTTGRFSIADAGDDFITGSNAGIVVSGDLTPIPLPAGALLLAGALAAGAAVSRRRGAPDK